MKTKSTLFTLLVLLCSGCYTNHKIIQEYSHTGKSEYQHLSNASVSITKKPKLYLHSIPRSTTDAQEERVRPREAEDDLKAENKARAEETRVGSPWNTVIEYIEY